MSLVSKENFGANAAGVSAVVVLDTGVSSSGFVSVLSTFGGDMPFRILLVFCTNLP